MSELGYALMYGSGALLGIGVAGLIVYAVASMWRYGDRLTAVFMVLTILFLTGTFLVMFSEVS